MLSIKNFCKTMEKPFQATCKAVITIKGLIFLVLMLLIPFTGGQILKAQNPEWKVYNTSNSGLQDNWVSNLAIDGSGNIWIGTYGEGLAKYDGSNWIIYDTTNSCLPDNYVNCLTVDDSGNIWIGTGSWQYSKGGLAKYDGSNWTVYNSANSGLLDNDVGCLAVDVSRNVWIGTWGGERSGDESFVKYDGMNWTVYNTSNSGLPSNDVICLAIGENGTIWIGGCDFSYGALTKYDGTNWTVYNTFNSGLPDNDVNSIAIDGSGNIWTGTGNGLAKYDGTNWAVYNSSNSGLPNNGVFCIAIDSSGNKWIGTLGGGLAVFNEGGIVSVKEFENKSEHYPVKFILSQNYPNPFNPSTRIKYSIPKQSYVTLKVYDILGREVATLVNEEKRAGNYEVEFSQASGIRNLASGIYFYRLQTGNFVAIKKMILLR